MFAMHLSVDGQKLQAVEESIEFGIWSYPWVSSEWRI